MRPSGQSVALAECSNTRAQTPGATPYRRTIESRVPLPELRDLFLYEEVRKVSPLLGSRHGLDTAEDSMEVIATKIAELVHV